MFLLVIALSSFFVVAYGQPVNISMKFDFGSGEVTEEFAQMVSAIECTNEKEYDMALIFNWKA